MTAMKKSAAARPAFDRDLADLPAELRWREWMGRVEVVLFAAGEPVPRQILAGLVGGDCNLDLLIDDIRAELRPRPFDIVPVAGGAWQFRTRPGFADAIAAVSVVRQTPELSELEGLALITVAYHQPVTRAEIGQILGKDIHRDIFARLRTAGLIGPGPRSPVPGAPYTFVTTERFLTVYGLETLHDLPDIERLRDAGLLSNENVLADILPPLEDEAERDGIEEED
jgi:chromosome segregation and condensation protein ScpB